MKRIILAVSLAVTAALFAAPVQAAPVDPALTVAGFGASFGLPTGCQLATAAANDFASRANSAEAFSPIANAVNKNCDDLAAAGLKATQDAKSAGLAKELTPFINPAVGQVAGAVSQTGTDYSDAIAPFGNTVAGLGGTINFFQSS